MNILKIVMLRKTFTSSFGGNQDILMSIGKEGKYCWNGKF
jgi:hypothetical protein